MKHLLSSSIATEKAAAWVASQILGWRSPIAALLQLGKALLRKRHYFLKYGEQIASLGRKL